MSEMSVFMSEMYIIIIINFKSIKKISLKYHSDFDKGTIIFTEKI